MILVEARRIRAAVQWNGSNTSEVQELLDFIGSVATFTVVGTDLHVDDTAATNGGEPVIESGNWLMQAPFSSGSVSEQTGDIFDDLYIKTY